MAVLTLADFDITDVQCPDLYGISSHLKILKLAYFIGLHPDFKIVKTEDLALIESAETFITYQIHHLDVESPFYLIKNKATSEVLLHDYKSIDYIITSDCDKKYILEIINYVSELNEVSICFAIENLNDSDKIKFEQLL